MSFWASSYSFELESAFAACCSVINVVRCGFVSTMFVRKPARCFPGLQVSIESFGAI
jgi:hypothetical protein